ncbi:MAG: DUF5916 domain-containing protein [Acidobacteriota bacterium]
MRRVGIVLAVFASSAPLLSQTPEIPPPLAISRTAGPIHVDGSLSDPGWQGAASMEDFWETQPGDNLPARFRTSVLLAYDEKSLYIGIRCDDPRPPQIRAPYVDRDQVLGTDDNVAVFLDPRNDRRSAVEFRVNPRGIQGDAVWNEANQTEDFSPDFFYDSAASVTPQGWTAEIRIPFSSLRYGRQDPQSWGILFWRNYPREFRYAFHSSPIPRGSNCLICHMRTITGLSGLPSAGHFVAAPYVTGKADGRPEDRSDPRSDFSYPAPRGNAGGDVKWTPDPDKVIDATINPDFSQIESDVAQISVNQRFALFYPEKRPFFLEGVDLLQSPIQAVYTRTITSPRWGGRLTGKDGDSAYTFLVSEDRGGGLVILPGAESSGAAPQDFRSIAAIARVRHDFGPSFAGLLATDREVSGGGHNRVLGPDLQWRPSDRDQLTAQFLYSQTQTPDRPQLAAEWDGRSLSGGALDAAWSHQTRTLAWQVRYRDFADGFRADDGYVPQVGIRQVTGQAGYTFYPEGVFRRLFARLGADYVADRAGRLVSRRFSPAVDFNGAFNLAGFLGVDVDAVRTGDRVLERTQAVWSISVDPSRRLTRIIFNGNLGSEIDFEDGRTGHGGDLSVSVTTRPTDHLELSFIGDRRWLNVEGGRLFTADVARLKATYTFTARAFFRAIAQYVATTRDPTLSTSPVGRKTGDFDGSALFAYKLNWQTVFFLGYGDTRALAPAPGSGAPPGRYDLVPVGRQLFLKFSYAFQG